MLAIAIKTTILLLANHNRVLAFSSSSSSPPPPPPVDDDVIFPNSIPINQPNDILTLQRQIGQIAPGKAAIGKPKCCKCQYGFPQAFTLDPIPDGTNRINSGLIKLTCPILVNAIDQMEDDGYIKIFTNLVKENEILQKSVQESHLIHSTTRKRIIHQKDKKRKKKLSLYTLNIYQVQY